MMKQTIQLPFSQNQAFKALTDPILLSVWLGIPAVTAGIDKYHVLEAADWRTEKPWMLRCILNRHVSNSLLEYEVDESWKKGEGNLSFALSTEGETVVLRAEWESRYCSPLIQALANPSGLMRVKRLLEE